MKKIFFITMLISMIITEIIILNKQNIEIKENNNKILEELKENNLVINNKISLSTVTKEKEQLQEETYLVFKEEKPEEIFEKQKELGENLNKEIFELEEKIIGLETNLSRLEKEHLKLLKEYEAKNTFYVTGFPFINQYPDYPTGCESVSLTMLLNYHKIAVTPDMIIESIPKGNNPYTKDGITYGGNPEVEFVGNPYSLNAYGIYEKPIAEVANKFKSGITIATGTNFDDILKIVGTGKPVMVWTSMYLASPYISSSWIYEPTGEKIYWKANEHAVVVIGYTTDKVIIADPIGGKMKYQSLSIFRERYNYFGKKALYY